MQTNTQLCALVDHLTKELGEMESKRPPPANIPERYRKLKYALQEYLSLESKTTFLARFGNPLAAAISAALQEKWPVIARQMNTHLTAK